MPFRDRELAQRGRAELLEQELETLRRENDGLRRHRDGVRRHRGATILWVLCAVLATAAVLVGAWVDAWEAEYIAGALGVLSACCAAAAMLARLIHVVRPGALLVISGRQTRAPDGTMRGYRVVRGGRVLRVPLLEHAETMDLRSETIDLELASVATRDGKARVSARALIRLCSQEPRLHNAVERFLGRERDEVMRAARQTIEGAMVGIVAQVRVVELQEDRLRVANEIQLEVELHFANLGLELEQLQILDVSA